MNQDMLRWMFNEAKRINLTTAGYHGGLVLDEMNVQKDLQISKKGDQWHMIGLKDLGGASNAIGSIMKGDDAALADHVL